MPNTPELDAQIEALKATVTKATTVAKSAELLIAGFSARLDAAIEAAESNGASVAELAPLAELSAALDAQSDALAAAVVAGTGAPA